MKVFGLLERAQAEPLASDPTGAGLIVGRFFYHSGTDSFKYYGVSMRTVVNTDQAQTLDNKSLTTVLFPHQTTPSNPASGNIKVYSKNDDKLYVLDENGNETSVGSGGGGSLNFYEKGDADLAQVGEFSQGSDPTFGNGGASSSTFALTATNPARGTKSFEMTLNGTPSASNNDYVRSELIPIPLGYRGQFLTINLRYNYDGLNDDIKFVVRDETNSVIITDTTEKFEKYTNSNGYKEFSFVVYVAQSCANLSVGPQVVSHAAGSEVLKWDDVLVTPDLTRSTSLKDDTEIISYTGFLTRSGNDVQLASVLEDTSKGLLAHTSNAGGTRIQILKDCYIAVTYNCSTLSGINLSQIVLFNDTPVIEQYSIDQEGSGGIAWAKSTSLNAYVKAGYELRVRTSVNVDNNGATNFTCIATPLSSTEHILTPAKTGDIGAIQAFGTTTTPDGFLYCDGSSLLRSQYADLFASLGTAYGTADGDHFNLPDFRGNFMRGYDGVGADPDAASRVASKPGGNTGDNIGSYQGHAFQTHIHNYDARLGAIQGDLVAGSPHLSRFITTQGTTAPVTGTTSSETRPVNVSVRYYVRYRSSVTTAALPKVYAGIVGDVRHSLLTEAQFQTYAGEGWVLMDGRSVVGSAYEAITGNTNIPDARGRALRMKDNAAGVNPDGDLALGTLQSDAFQGHWHQVGVNSSGALGNAGVSGKDGGVQGSPNRAQAPVTDGVNGTPRISSETRMANATVNFFVKIN